MMHGKPHDPLGDKQGILCCVVVSLALVPRWCSWLALMRGNEVFKFLRQMPVALKTAFDPLIT